MRRFVVAVAVILTATSVFAADPGKTQLSIFTSDIGFARTDYYSEHTGGLGLALSHALTPRWSVELKVAQERHYTGSVTYTNPSGPPDVNFRTFHSVPVDLLGQYRFPNSSRWTPYVSAGVHYVSVPTITSTFTYHDAQGNVQSREMTLTHSRTAGAVGVGTSLRITPHFGLRFDANVLVAPGEFYDDMFRPSLGLSWRF